MPSKSKSNVTTDHEEIRRWVEERGGHPTAVKSTRGGRGKGDRTGILRIDFPGYSSAGSLEEISWEEFFAKFDKEKLAQAIRVLVADPDLRQSMGDAGRAFALSRFDTKVMVAGLERVYRDAAERVRAG